MNIPIIAAIAWNVIRRTIGTRNGILGLLLLPSVVVSLTYVLLGGIQEEEPRVAFMIQDQGAEAAVIRGELQSMDGIEIMEMTELDAMRKVVTDKRAVIGIRVPETFSTELRSGAAPSVEFYEIAVSESGYAVKATLESAIQRMSHTVAMLQSLPTERREPAIQSWLARELTPAITVSTIDENLYPKQGLRNGTGFMLLFLLGLVTSAVTLMTRDRNSHILARMYMAPVSSAEITLGYFMGSLAVGCFQIVLILGVTRGIFGFDYGVPLLPHFVILMFFTIVALGLSSTVAGMIRNQTNAGMLNPLIVSPTCMLGGCFWPISIMPDFLQKLANFMPQKWAIQAIETMAAGGEWADIMVPLAILGCMAIILIILGATILRPHEAGIKG